MVAQKEKGDEGGWVRSSYKNIHTTGGVVRSGSCRQRQVRSTVKRARVLSPPSSTTGLCTVINAANFASDGNVQSSCTSLYTATTCVTDE
jgi:hypothetical protein